MLLLLSVYCIISNIGTAIRNLYTIHAKKYEDLCINIKIE